MDKGFKVRSYSRVPMSCPVRYEGNGLTGSGLVLDLSVSGWRIKGDTPVSEGQHLTLRVSFPSQSTPIDIDTATVQWVKGTEFGVNIVKIGEEAERSVKKFVESFLNAGCIR